jgi:RNA polymerase sigma-70 factor (ECF subfamily)
VVANRAAGRGRRLGSERRAFGRWLGRPVVAVELEPADERFWTEVRQLPRRQAEVIALHYLEELSVAEVAAVLGCAEGTVKSHLHRGRLALARSLGIGEGDER